MGLTHFVRAHVHAYIGGPVRLELYFFCLEKMDDLASDLLRLWS